ncbi:TadE/TadG family type IV pilus assembly protein [Pedococcus sp. 2YAF34]|uniref:TadE/TadG family type IV pilus assembly protein n=1 Tax=Pedococcus sp. 2YAF34 TaxID=3233032 RepID=UPI003F97CB9E
MEFALVMPVLFVLLFGIIDYGLLFNDLIGLRQGAREAARQGVVQQFDLSCTTGTAMDKIACSTRRASESTLGTSPVRVRVLTPDGWVQGGRLVVCAQVKERSLTGMVPFPSKPLQTRTIMSIENVTTSPSPLAYLSDAAPDGGDWDPSWC